jgi:hypothetical protein
MPNKKYIEDHPYLLYSKPILTDEDMLENQNPFMTLWTTDALFGEFSDRAVPREVVENNKTAAAFWQRTNNPGLLCGIKSDIKKTDTHRCRRRRARKL